MIANVTDAGELCALLPLHVLTVGTGYPQKSIARPSGAPYYHIFAVEKGSGVFEADGKKTVLCAGTVIFIKKDYPINYSPNGDEFVTGWVTFDGPCAAGLVDYYRAFGVFLQGIQIADRYVAQEIRQIIRRIIQQKRIGSRIRLPIRFISVVQSGERFILCYIIDL